jgi:hypothetical protein
MINITRSLISCSCKMPPISEQAPSYKVGAPTATSATGAVGSVVRKVSTLARVKVGVNPTTCYVIWAAPASARMQSCQVPTTSKSCGANPSPISAVGILSPQSACAVQCGGNVAPANNRTWWYVAIGVAVALWMFGGLAVIRRML